MTFDTREAWLTEAADRLADMVEEHTALKPSSRVLVSCGWPRRDRNGKVIGQCWKKQVGNGVHHIFVSPTITDRVEVLACVLHELIHAADDCKHGHKGAFRKAWKALGFEGKPTECTTGKELRSTLSALSKDLGPYPHQRLNPARSDPPQTTRMLKIECPECGCLCRMTRKWLEETGAPTCACGTPMEEA